MLRLLVACVLGVGIFALIAWQFNLLASVDVSPGGNTKTVTKLRLNVALGENLYPAAAVPPASRTSQAETRSDHYPRQYGRSLPLGHRRANCRSADVHR